MGGIVYQRQDIRRFGAPVSKILMSRAACDEYNMGRFH